MTISEEKLLQSGFTASEVRKLKNNIDNYGGSFDIVIHDLANRFKASGWITVVALIILFLVTVLAARDKTITLLITLAMVLPFIWYLAPAKLAYKSWRYTKQASNAGDRH